MKIVLASNNAGKIHELTSLLAPLDLEVIPQAVLGVKDIEETGLSFIENALLKARHAARVTGFPVIADDSGLAVAALHGQPGIHSARYAGPKAESRENIQKLLSAMESVPDNERQACFHCVLVYLSEADDPTPIVCEGKWDGMILRQPVGDAGFGYDPIFFDPHEKQSAAELPAAIKNSISHRGKALQTLLKQLAKNT